MAIPTDWKAEATNCATGDINAIGRSIRNIMETLSGNSTSGAGLLDVTAGTVTASKAIVVDSSKTIDTLTVTTPKVGVTDASTAAAISNTGITTISSTATSVAYTMDPPAAGVRKTLHQTGSSTAVTVTLTSGTFDGTNGRATFNAAADSLELVGLSTARFAIVGNIGSVALSTV